MTSLTLWDGPRQHEVYSWLKVELANLRAAFRWAPDRNDIDAASAIAIYAASAGFWSDQYEPIRWNEELVGPARAAGHRRLAQLYGMAVLCFTSGRIDEAIGYAAAGQEAVISGRFDEIRRESEASLGGPYAAVGAPERWVDWCRIVMGRHPVVAHPYPRHLCARTESSQAPMTRPWQSPKNFPRWSMPRTTRPSRAGDCSRTAPLTVIATPLVAYEASAQGP